MPILGSRTRHQLEGGRFEALPQPGENVEEGKMREWLLLTLTAFNWSSHRILHSPAEHFAAIRHGRTLAVFPRAGLIHPTRGTLSAVPSAQRITE